MSGYGHTESGKPLMQSRCIVSEHESSQPHPTHYNQTSTSPTKLYHMILLLILTCASFASPCELLSGSWINELGSVANIHAHAKTGELSGDYTSAVGAANGQYPLVGTYQRDACNPTFAFTVTWDNAVRRANSTSAWSGVFVNGTLYTTWLLTSQVANSADAWQATRIGSNVFYRT